MAVGSSSYQTTHATVSFGPVKAMSGSTPERVGSTLSVGSPVASEVGSLGFSRPSPTSCQQNPFRLIPPAGLVPSGHGTFATSCLSAFSTKICRRVVSSSGTPSFSSHVTHGTGSLPATAAPPATDGFSAVRSVWTLSDGSTPPAKRLWPDGSHRLAAALKRLAKMLVGQVGAVECGSYHATQGTVRPAPAKSIDGPSASTVGSTLSDAGNPCVTHAPFLNARTKMCCSPSAILCSNVAHGTAGLPAVSAPPTTSETPASFVGSIEFAGSSLTCAPVAGRGRNAARAGGVATSAPAAVSAATVRRRRRARVIASKRRANMGHCSFGLRARGERSSSCRTRRSSILGDEALRRRSRAHLKLGAAAASSSRLRASGTGGCTGPGRPHGEEPIEPSRTTSV